MTDHGAGRALSTDPAGRRLLSGLYRRPRLQLGLLLSTPLLWLVVAYLGSLGLMFVAAFWRLDAFSGSIDRSTLTLANFEEILTTPVYRDVAVRTIVMAALVTLADAVIAFPVAFFMARVASPRARGFLIVSITLPLWSGYLVKVYAWRLMLLPNGFIDSLLRPIGLSGPGLGDVAVWLVFVYLWLPYMVLPIYAGLEQIPRSLLEASSDLGGHAATTFRRVVLPLAIPAVIAGSIFTFSLTLGDYIVPGLVGTGTQFIGTIVYDNVGIANDLPLAAAYALVPVAVMIGYLLAARRTGAFESL
ncbi:MAG: ABC transporter permease [Candidatus Limnocylindrales bacterium]